MLAYLEVKKGCRGNHKLLKTFLPSLGLILICHSVVFFNEEIFHPSFYTLSPIAGVCFIIWFSNKDEIVTKLLSTKIFVGISFNILFFISLALSLFLLCKISLYIWWERI